MWLRKNHVGRDLNQVNSESRSRVNSWIYLEKSGHDPKPLTAISLVQSRGFSSSIKTLTKFKPGKFFFSSLSTTNFPFLSKIFSVFSSFHLKPFWFKEETIIIIKPHELWAQFFFQKILDYWLKRQRVPVQKTFGIPLNVLCGCRWVL